VSIGLGNKININKYTSYSLFYNYDQEQTESIVSKVQNTKKQEIIGNNKCTVYQIDYFYKEEGTINKEPYASEKLCVDESSPINNVPVFLSSGGSFGGYYFAKTQYDNSMKGLVMKIENPNDDNSLVLKSMEKINETAYFDFQKQREEVKKYAEQQKKELESYVTEEAMDAAADLDLGDPDSDEYYISPYESAYKNEKKSVINLAISNIPSEKLWDGLPKYCRKIEDSMPDFKNKDLKSHLKNYVGQMCDMYLTQYEYHSVAVKETLDEIRKESLYLNEARKKMDKKDLEQLDAFLNDLD
jgi:hypothetical protein